ncbi:MAG: hypothetical protein LBT83_02220 [Tannerella sp.]|jgi:hypothetical protein|nr:hypothetical protein [Tannerella sp.]
MKADNLSPAFSISTSTANERKNTLKKDLGMVGQSAIVLPFVIFSVPLGTFD